ncbi:MAG: T9SS C-terminal target domain-containing protein [Calditrichaeota bacterium]|nr:MAG: T9SS C-terminal target domain-containing protein [Calditrichota bacterium]
MSSHSRSFSHYFFYVILCLTLGLHADAQLDDNPLQVTTTAGANAITTSLSNYGSLSGPGNGETDMVWQGLGYAYEINFFVGAEVEVPPGSHADAYEANGVWKAHVISDGLKSSGGEISPDGTERWGWQPLDATDDGQQLVDVSHPDIPKKNDYDIDGDGHMDSWPREWTAWPDLWHQGDSDPRQEYLYAMDDRDNREFAYYPFENDSSRQGLGIQVTCRTVQGNRDGTQNALISIYDIKNISDKDLSKVQGGLWGDPHIGGADDWRDDWAVYDSVNNLIVLWDDDGQSLNNPSVTPGFMGIVFLETPGNPVDGIDNDGDGITDESRFDGIDNDGDWNPLFDDVGADGLPNTGDSGENDGVPTAGEPHFDLTDMDEADMTGLQAFPLTSFLDTRLEEDEKVWQLLTPGNMDVQQTPGDYPLLAGSGYFSLKSGESKRFTVAFVMGEDHDQLLNNVQKVRDYYRTHLGNFIPEHPFPLTLEGNPPYTSEVPLKWASETLTDTDSLFLLYSTNNGQTWKTYEQKLPNSGQYNVSTATLPASVFYKFKLESVNGAYLYTAISDSFFTVDNSGADNVAPEVLWDFRDGISLSGLDTLLWRDGDADGDPITRQLIVQSTVITDTLWPYNAGWVLNTADYPNGSYTLTVHVSDGRLSASSVKQVTFSNSFEDVENTYVTHLQGPSESIIHAAIADRSAIKKALYVLTFDRQDDQTTLYSVYDSTRKYYLIKNDPLPIAPESGRFFDGLTLAFDNPEYRFLPEKSGWSDSAHTNLEISMPNDAHKPLFHDLEFRFDGAACDTSINGIIAPYAVWDSFTGKKLKQYIVDLNSNGTWEPGEVISPLNEGATTDDIIWYIIFDAPDNTDPVLPEVGARYTFKVAKPLSAEDRYLIDTNILNINTNPSYPAGYALQQNYPNPFNPVTTINYRLDKSGPTLLEVYDIRGRRVRTLINGYQTAGTHRVHFDGSAVASGVYFYRLSSGGQQLSRLMLLIK